MRIDIGVAAALFATVELLFHAGHAGGNRGCEGEIRIGVAARHAVFDPQGGAVSDDAKACGAVVGGPCQPGWRPARGLEAFVGVDRRRKEAAELRRVFDEAAEELPEELRAAFAFRVPKKICAVAPDARVDVATVSRLGDGILRHEGHGAAVLGENFLHALLEDNVHVGHRHRLRVGEIDLVLTAPPFAFARLDRDARCGHLIADAAKYGFVPRRLHRVVIDAVIT